MLDGNWNQKFDKVECMECLTGKATRAASSSNPVRATKALINLSIDLWGPATTRSRQGHYYFLTCYDDFSRYVYTAPLKSKDNALVALIEYVHLVENQLERTVKTIRSDQGGEFSSNQFKQWCGSKGIEQTFTPAAAHNQNSRVERIHLTLMNDVRTMLIDSMLPKTFWVDALQHAVYTRNRLPNAEGIIPINRFKAESRPDSEVYYKHMRAFGSPCVYRVVNQLSKLDARACPGKMIGNGLGTTSYTILTEENRIIVSRDVVFPSSQSQPSSAPLFQESTINVSDREGDLDLEDSMPRRLDRSSTTEADIDTNDQIEPIINQPRRSRRLQDLPAEFMEPLEGAPEIIQDTPGLEHALSAQELQNPQSYQQARNSAEWEDWKAAMDEKMSKMKKYSV